jgi:hypothetical protein
MTRKKVLFIGGSLNQTKMAHAVSRCLVDDYDCYFTPMYCDVGLLKYFSKKGWLDFTIMGGPMRRQTENYLAKHKLPLDYAGQEHDYDLVITGSDLIIQKNIRSKPIILIQEGMTDPENWMYHLVRWFRLPRYLASTSTNGLSNAYRYFCVASHGYKDFFIRKGIDPAKIIVTGIPNYDNLADIDASRFPYRNYVLVATSDARETFKRDNRKQFIREAVKIANGRQLIFKPHPNENIKRTVREIKEVAPNALIFTEGNIDPMIANCDILITQYSTVVYTGIVLGKEVHSYFDVDELRRLAPKQNGGTSGQNIARVCHRILETEMDAAYNWPHTLPATQKFPTGIQTER